MKDLSIRQIEAIRLLGIPNSDRTCTIIGAALTKRRSSFGHQTSAREGGRTLHSLQRRGLAYHFESNDGIHRLWKLTREGEDVLREIKMKNGFGRRDEGDDE